MGRNLYIGLMSGTSMDGIDAALVDVESHQLIASYYLEYEIPFKAELEKFSTAKQVEFDSYAYWDKELGLLFAKCANELVKTSIFKKKDIAAIGSHGQTIRHAPLAKTPYTLQLGCPHTISNETQMTVVANFRQKDICNGGQGAPLAPIYHKELFYDQNKNRAVVNIGGISNLSCINKSAQVWGFDIGPGNCLMDRWIYEQLKLTYDKDGQWASLGVSNERLLSNLLSDPFFKKTRPKSVDKEYFSLSWLESHMPSYQLESCDIQATLLSLTTKSIVQALQEDFACCDELLICGGGMHNQTLVNQLKTKLTPIKVSTLNEIGVDGDYLEAMMFAWFASKTLNKQAIDLGSITGSRKPTILGGIYHY